SGYRTALEFIPMTVTLVGTSLIAGRILPRTGSRTLVGAGALVAGGGILLAGGALSRAGAPAGWLVWVLALVGIGFGAVIVPVTEEAISTVPAEHSGMSASATITS